MMRATLLPAILLLLSSCGNPHAYPKVKTLNARFTYCVGNVDSAFIMTGGSEESGFFVIPPHIDRVALRNGVVFGHLTPSPKELAGARTPENLRGFFYLDPNSGEYKMALPQDQWREYLLKRGIESPEQYLEERL